MDTQFNHLPDSHPLVTVPEDKPCILYRHKLMAITFLAFTTMMANRLSFNIALVSMVNYTAIDHNITVSDECPGVLNTTISMTQGDFDWDPTVQGQLLAAFYYGYVITQVPGGYIAEVIGTKKVFGAIFLVSSLLSLITPIVARWNVQALIGIRVLNGLVQGPMYPALNALWGQWAPVYERSQLSGWSGSGGNLGTILSQVVTGYLCSMHFLGGWPLPFYVFGVSGLLIFVLWVFCVHDSIEKHPGLSTYERLYLQRNNSATTHTEDSKALKRPWFLIFTSGPVLAINLYGLFTGIGYYIVSTGIPIYLKQILKYDIAQEGVIMSIVSSCSFSITMLILPAADKIMALGWLSTIHTRKLFVLIGDVAMAVFIIGLAQVDCNRILAVSMITLALSLVCFDQAGPAVNTLDICPIYAGTVQGISNLCYNIGGFVGPAIVGAMTHDLPNQRDWQRAFYVSSGLFVVACIVYTILASGKEQPWAKDKKTEQSVSVQEE